MNTPPYSRRQSWIRTFSIAALLAAAPLTQAYQTASGQVYDDSGQEIQLRGVNWFGFETDTHSPHGLWARNYKDMIGQMKSLGFNAVRLPFCPASLHNAPVSGVDFGLNPDLQGLNATQMMDRIIDEFDQQDMYILLDHHRPDCEAISQLWYTDRYSEDQWLDDLARVAERYKDVPHVIGVDLKNEPHGAATWGTGNPATDWNLAAERAAFSRSRRRCWSLLPVSNPALSAAASPAPGGVAFSARSTARGCLFRARNWF